MSVANYAAPCFVHPDRYGAVKTQGDDLWFVLHTTEGSEGDNSAEGLAAMLARPGDRPNGRGGFYGSSYHAITDTDRIIPAVPYTRVAYSAGGGNARGRHLVIPGSAGQTRAQWLDPVSRAYIAQAAAWAVDQGVGWLFRTHRLTVAEVQTQRLHGLCDHDTISKAFRKSDHWDVGPHFPWDVLYADIAGHITPTEPNRRVIDMYVFRLQEKRWPWFVDVVVAADGIRAAKKATTGEVDERAGVPIVPGTKAELIDMLSDRPGIGSCPFQKLPQGDFSDSDLRRAWG